MIPRCAGLFFVWSALLPRQHDRARERRVDGL
nr:MAG TPA: hypothetical protein [Caudoviricetes sp.]